MKNRHEKRIIGTYGEEQTGPLIVVVGGIHGNEPAGIRAIERVLARLTRDQVRIQGKLVGIRGNVQALAAGERYLTYDLNRLWQEERIILIREKRKRQHSLTAEEVELLALLETLHTWEQTSYSPKVLIDLHTTSAPDGRFSVVENDEASLKLAATLQAPIILGLTQALIGTLATHCVATGWQSLAYEAGQHHDPHAINDHVAALWSLLHHLGCLPPELEEHAQTALRHLKQEHQHLPPVVEVVYRHAIRPQDQFKMRPGYVNFQPVTAGEWLADDHQGQVLAPFDGLMLMPLYQPQGADGFFIVQPLTQDSSVSSLTMRDGSRL